MTISIALADLDLASHLQRLFSFESGTFERERFEKFGRTWKVKPVKGTLGGVRHF